METKGATGHSEQECGTGEGGFTGDWDGCWQSGWLSQYNEKLSLSLEHISGPVR